MLVILAYKKIKNMSISYIIFELNNSYHLSITFIENVNLYFKFRSVDKLIFKF